MKKDVYSFEACCSCKQFKPCKNHYCKECNDKLEIPEVFKDIFGVFKDIFKEKAE